MLRTSIKQRHVCFVAGTIGLFLKTFTSSLMPNLSTPWLLYGVYFTNILTLTSVFIKGPSLITNHY